MSFIKNIDYFQKFSFDIQKSTFIGATVSILSISVISLLILREFWEYLSPSIKKDAIIFNDENQNNFIKFNFGLHLYGSPCSLSSVIYQEEMGITHINTYDSIKYTRFDKQHKVIDQPFDTSLQTASKMLSDDEGCEINGFIPINRTPGVIVFSPSNYRQLYFSLLVLDQDRSKSFSLRHKFFYIIFGEKDLDKSVLNRFGFKNVEEFNRKDLPNYQNSDKVNFDYFIKIIPHILYDESSGKRIVTYQYSINYNERPKVHGQDVPMISLKFDISDVTIVVTLINKSFFHFLTHICAIVGGVFVIFSILNRILLYIIDSFSSDENKK